MITKDVRNIFQGSLVPWEAAEEGSSPEPKKRYLLYYTVSKILIF